MDGNVVLNQTMFGNVMQNVLSFSNMPDTPADRLIFAQALRDLWESTFDIPDVQRIVPWNLVSLTFVYNDSSGPPTFSVEVPIPGGVIAGNVVANSSSVPAQQIALLVSLTADGPPPNRGRVYMGGVSANLLEATGQWAGGALATHNTLFTEMATLGVGGSFLRIARKDSSGRITTSVPVENVISRPVPATQRRRRLGVGI